MNLEALVRASVAGDNRSITDQWVVDTWVWDQVGLEFIKVDVQSTVESQTGGDGADNLSDETVKVLISRARDVKVAVADVVHGFVVNEECAVGVLNGAVGRENSVVGFNNGGRDAGSWVDGEFKLGFLSIVGRKTLK